MNNTKVWVAPNIKNRAPSVELVREKAMKAIDAEAKPVNSGGGNAKDARTRTYTERERQTDNCAPTSHIKNKKKVQKANTSTVASISTDQVVEESGGR